MPAVEKDHVKEILDTLMCASPEVTKATLSQEGWHGTLHCGRRVGLHEVFTFRQTPERTLILTTVVACSEDVQSCYVFVFDGQR